MTITNSGTVARAAAVAVLLAAYVCGVSAAVGWSTRESIIPGLSIPSVTVSLGNMAFVGAGADSQSGAASSYVFTYNSITQRASNYSAALTPGRRLAGVAVVGRNIIFAGGVGGSTFYATANVINVDTGEQTEIPNALSSQRGVVFACSNAAKTKAIFWGGIGASGTNVQQPDVFNGTNWMPVELPPNYILRTFLYRSQIGGTAGSDVCVLAGGTDTGSNVLYTADIYTFSTGVLRSNVSGLTVPRRDAAAASYGNRVVFAGGQHPVTNAPLSSIEYYDAGTDSWGVLSVALSVARSYLSAVATTDGGLVFFAGGHSNTYESVVDMYNTSSGAMTTTRPLTLAATQLSSVAVGTQVLLFGGYDLNENSYPYTEVYESSYCAGTPCANGGTCVNGFTGYSCVCANGYSGPTCATSGGGTGGMTGGTSATGSGAESGTFSAAGAVRVSGLGIAVAVLVVAAAALRV